MGGKAICFQIQHSVQGYHLCQYPVNHFPLSLLHWYHCWWWIQQEPCLVCHLWEEMDRTSDPTKIVKAHLIRQDRRWMFLGIFLVRKSQGREEESENTDQHLLKQLSKSLQVSLGSWVTDAVFRRVWAQQSSTKFLWFVRSAHTHKTSLHSENNAVHLLKNEHKHFYKTGRFCKILTLLRKKFQDNLMW